MRRTLAVMAAAGALALGPAVAATADDEVGVNPAAVAQGSAQTTNEDDQESDKTGLWGLLGLLGLAGLAKRKTDDRTAAR